MRLVIVAPGVDGWCFALLPIFNISKWPKGLRISAGWLVFIIELEWGVIGNG